MKNSDLRSWVVTWYCRFREFGTGTKGRKAVAKPIRAQVVTRTFDRVSIAYVKEDGTLKETGRVYARDELDHGYWYVWGLEVRARYRGQGIGGQLMQEVIDTYGYDRLELIPSAVNPKNGLSSEQLVSWYERFGFKTGPSANTDRPARESDTRRMYRPGPRSAAVAAPEV